MTTPTTPPSLAKLPASSMSSLRRLLKSQPGMLVTAASLRRSFSIDADTANALLDQLTAEGLVRQAQRSTDTHRSAVSTATPQPTHAASLRSTESRARRSSDRKAR